MRSPWLHHPEEVRDYPVKATIEEVKISVGSPSTVSLRISLEGGVVVTTPPMSMKEGANLGRALLALSDHHFVSLIPGQSPVDLDPRNAADIGAILIAMAGETTVPGII